MSQEDVPNLEFVLKLLLFGFSRLWDLYYYARSDFIDEGDASFPDPMYVRILVFDRHDRTSRNGLLIADSAHTILC